MRVPLACAIAAIAAAVAPAAAQSRRYPPEPVDQDAVAGAKSRLWDAATNPQRTPYAALIARASESLENRTSDGPKAAVAALDEAIRLVPDDPEAYRLRGEAHLMLQSWARCAEDLQAASARARDDAMDRKQVIEQRRRLGICQARAGRLADAERTLAEAAATGLAGGEIWTRLGEVRIAMGKLEEAIVALETGIEYEAPPALVRWLLAGAFDRARRPGDAADAARRAIAIEPQLGTLENPSVPFLGAGEREYLFGLAYAAGETPRPEFSLLYFRRFLELSPESPWRRRAEEHLRELKTSELPEQVERKSGNAPLDTMVARAAVRRAMPAMRACVAKVSTVFEVEITKVGPRTPAGSRDAPRFYAPPDGIKILHQIPTEQPRAEIDAAIRCLEPLAARLVMPRIKDRDAWYRAVFYVVGP